VPLAKSSTVVVPPNGMSRWVCGSMKPGKTYAPEASTVSCPSPRMLRAIAVIVPSSTRTSAGKTSVAVTTVPALTMMPM
jgi:hypothetical protein